MRYTQFVVLFFIILLSPVSGQYGINVKHTFFETNHQIYHAGFSDKGNYIITAGSDNNVIIWNAETGIIYRTLAGLKKRPNIALFSEENNYVLSAGEDMKVTIWDPVTRKISESLEGHTGSIKTMDISPDGAYLATGSSDKTIRVWKLSDKKLIYELKAHKKDVNAVKFSPDGTRLVSGSADCQLILWDMTNGNTIASTIAHKGWIRDVKFSADGKKIASCGDDKLIKIWNANDLSFVNSLSGHKGWVQTIQFTPDGNNLVSGGHDQQIILWDVASGEILFKSPKQDQIVLSVDISPKKPDLISCCLLSEELKSWALSGLDEAQWLNITPENHAKEILTDLPPDKTGEVSKESESNPDKESGENKSGIEIFSPIPVNGKIVCNDNKIMILGKVNDPSGINTFLINKSVVNLSPTGVFEYTLDLVRGENQVQFLSINSLGKIAEKKFIVDCNAVNAPQSGQRVIAVQGVYHALIIGVNEYRDGNLSDLDNPIKDAENLYRILVSKYVFDEKDIILLKNPTRTEMVIALDGLSKKLTEKDNLLIFFAGHGFWDEKGNIGYWMPSDADKDNTSNWFRNSTLRDFIGSIQTRHTLVIADACFSGAIFKTRAAFAEAPKGIQKLYELPSRKAMTSGILQEVPDKSVFLEFLLKRLDENNEKFLSSELLFSSFKAAVMNNSPNVPQFGIIQNVGDEGGDFIFIKK